MAEGDNLAASLTADDGLTALRRIISGDSPGPPIGDLLDFHLAEAEYGRVLFRGRPSPGFNNPLGTVHGGWAATLLDSALACAVHSTLAKGEAYTTLEFKVNLTRPILGRTGELHCEGRIVHRGRRVATSEAWLRDGDGKLYAHGTETCMVFAAAG